MKQLIARLLVPLLGLVGIVILTPAAAQASYSDSFPGYVYLWDDPNGAGQPALAVFRSPGLCYNVPTFFNDRADSFKNYLSNGHHVQFYRDRDCTGGALHQTNNNRSSGPFPSSPPTQDNFISARGINDRNKLTSIFFNNG
jgi:hypothetical protein